MLGLWLLVCVCLSSAPLSAALRVLSVLPFPMKSHHIMFNALLEALVSRGHHVVHYSGHPLPLTSPSNTNTINYKHIPIQTEFDQMFDKFTFDMIKDFIDQQQSSIFTPLPFQYISPIAEETLSLPQIQELIESDEAFDVVLLETFFSQEALLGFGYKFKAPVVALSTLGSFSHIDSAMGNPNPVSYIPNFSFPFSSHLSFYERLINGVKTLSENVYTHLVHIPRQEAITTKYFGSEVPPLVDLISQVPLVLLNSQPEVNYARAFLPNMIQVGGMHISASGKGLPKEIQKFMDEAENGVIYFSLGSTFSGSSVPEFFNEAFVRTFSKLQERVLWKIDSPPSNLSDNVMPVKWAPQLGILRHAKCKLFITHGGLLSLTEATYVGVPLIGIPIFADQPMNMAKVADAGVGVALHVYNVSEDSVQWALKEILHDQRYRRNMQRLSAQMRDRLTESPLDTAVHWVEYVAKYQGATQLRSPARSMSFIKYYMIDVLVFLSLILVVLMCVVFITIPSVCVKLFGFGKQRKLKTN